MEDGFMTDSSLSENTTEPGEEEPAPDQTPEESAEQQPEKEAYTGKEDTGQDVDEKAIAEKVVEMLQPEEDTSVDEKLDRLLDLLTLEDTEDGIEAYAAVFPFEEYEDWEYPIRMQFEVYPYGYGNWLKQYETYYDPDSFVTRYDEIVSLCQEGGSLKDFYVEYIWEDYGGDWETLVYDYEAVIEPEPEPEDPEPEEPVKEDDTAAQLLSHLEDINDTLMEMTAADMEFYESVLLYQDDMLELQEASVALEIVMAVGIFLTFGALLVKIMMERLR